MEAIMTGLVIMILIEAFLLIGSLVGNVFLFSRIGEKKWLGLIPFVNDFVIFRAFWNVKQFIIYMILYGLFYSNSIASGLCNLFGISLAEDFTFLPMPLYMVVIIALMFYIIRTYDKIAKGFNKNGFWTLGLVVCYPIFIILLAKKGIPSDEVIEGVKKRLEEKEIKKSLKNK